jgi:hypothetical protein
MRNRRQLGLILIALLALCTLACSGTSSDSGSTANAISSAAKAPSAASGEPALIRIEVVRREGPPIKGLVEDGSVLRLQDTSTGRAVAFKPVVHTKPAKIQVFAVEPGANGAESMRLLDETDVRIGATETKPVAKIYSVRILEVIPAT